MPDETAPRSGARLVVEALRVHGVKTVFCVPGESYLDVLDGLYDVRDEIELVACRHENGAAVMAEAYGKLTGRPGVCMVTRGPGACNASIGIHTAFQDSTPLVLLIGQVPRSFLGGEAFQEVDFQQMFAPLAKWVVQVESADEVSKALAVAFHQATADRPGPVVVILPEDVQHESTDAPDAEPIPAAPTLPDRAKLDRLDAIIATMAERPMLLLGGGGWSEAAKRDILSFAERSDIPVCTSFRRMDLIDNRHPCFVGDLGLAPLPGLVERFKQADVVLAVGTRLGEVTTQGYTLFQHGQEWQAFIHVHADAQELGRVFEPALAIHSDLAEFAQAMAARPRVGDGSWAEWRAAARQAYEDNLTPEPYAGALDLGRAMRVLDGRLTDDAILTVDAGNYAGFPQRFIPVGGKRRLLAPTNGAMGYGVPAAVAAKIVAPDRMVVGCCGDGGFGMTGQEIATAMAMGAAPIVLVFNNGLYGTIRMHQEARHPARVIGTDLVNPDYAALARAHGAFGETVERTEDFGPAFDRAVASGTLAVIELRMDPDVITARTTLTAIRKAAMERT